MPRLGDYHGYWPSLDSHRPILGDPGAVPWVSENVSADTRPRPLSSHTHSKMVAGGQKNECDFYKALFTIRGKDGKTKGIACAVDVDGKKNKDEVVLVLTWKGYIGEGKDSVKTVHRLFKDEEKSKRLPTGTFRRQYSKERKFFFNLVCLWE